jgi:hypothetical protein
MANSLARRIKGSSVLVFLVISLDLDFNRVCYYCCAWDDPNDGVRPSPETGET